MSATTDTLAHAGHAHGHDEHNHGPQKGIRRWLTTTNHKDIGTMYLVFSLIMFLIGGGMALVIRAELFMPGMQLVDPGFFNTMTTVHALIMVFGAVMPATVGLANWMLPLQIGAPDMALPRRPPSSRRLSRLLAADPVAFSPEAVPPRADARSTAVLRPAMHALANVPPCGASDHGRDQHICDDLPCAPGHTFSHSDVR